MNCSSDLKNFIYLFLAFSLKFQKVFSIARAFFFHSRSEQNTIPMAHSCDKLQKTRQKLVKLTDYPYACNIFTIIFLYILNVFFKVHPITSHPRSCVVKTTLFLWTGGPLVSFSTKCQLGAVHLMWLEPLKIPTQIQRIISSKVCIFKITIVAFFSQILAFLAKFWLFWPNFGYFIAETFMSL